MLKVQLFASAELVYLVTEGKHIGMVVFHSGR